MRKLKMRRIIKRLLLIVFVFAFLGSEGYAAIVSDNDGSAFVTKAEFDALKKNFNKQIQEYNDSIDGKIDGAIASYLAGIKIVSSVTPDLISNKIYSIYWYDKISAKRVKQTVTVPSGSSYIDKSRTSKPSGGSTNYWTLSYNAYGGTTSTDYYTSSGYDPITYAYSTNHTTYVKWTDMDDGHEVVGACWYFSVPALGSYSSGDYKYRPLACVRVNNTLGTKSLKTCYINAYLTCRNSSSYTSSSEHFKPSTYAVADPTNHGYPGSYGQNPSAPPSSSQAWRLGLYHGTRNSTANPTTWTTGNDIAATLQDEWYWSTSSMQTNYTPSATNPTEDSYVRQGTNTRTDWYFPSGSSTSNSGSIDFTYVMFGVQNTQQFRVIESSTDQWIGYPNSAFNGVRSTVTATYSGQQGYWYDPAGNTGIRPTVWPWAYNFASKCPSGCNILTVNYPEHWGLQYLYNYNNDYLTSIPQKPKMTEGVPLFVAPIKGIYRIKMTTTNSSSSECTNKVSFKIGAFANTTGNGNTLKLCDSTGNELSSYASQLAANDGTNKFDYYINCSVGDEVWVKLSPTNTTNNFARITNVVVTGESG